MRRPPEEHKEAPPPRSTEGPSGSIDEVIPGNYISTGFGGFGFFGLPSTRYLNRAEHSAMGMRPATCGKRYGLGFFAPGMIGREARTTTASSMMSTTATWVKTLCGGLMGAGTGKRGFWSRSTS